MSLDCTSSFDRVLTGLAKRGASELNSLNLEMAEDILQWLKLEKLL